METRKIIESLFTPASSGKTTAITALIGGLAAGAVIGVLFATETGKEARQKIRNTFSRLINQQKTNECSEPDTHSREPQVGKRPKSDIKNIIHEAHAATAHTEQGLS